MAEPSAHINYSFEDIQLYLQGNMSAQEMHDIEKAALQDPLLADALEGYNEVNPNIAQQHLNEINAALLHTKDETKVIAINRKTEWLRIAAIVIVTAGIGITGRYIFKKSKKEEQVVALQKEVKNNPAIKNAAADSVKAVTPTAVDSETAFTENKATGKSQLLSKKENNNLPVLKNKVAEADTVNTITAMTATSQMPDDKNKLESFDVATSKDKTIDRAPVLLQGKASGVAITDNTFRGKVIDENNKPIAGVAIETLNREKETLTDSAGNFSLNEQDSAIHVIASTVGYETKKASLEKSSNNKIVLKSATSSLDEVVVMGYGKVKEKAVEEAKPIGGWKKFKKYVASSLNKDSLNGHIVNRSNPVEMEFLIDEDGSPYNFRILKSPDDGMSSKVIDIVKSGPKWTSHLKEKKARVKITF
jgi:hypothetical protein